MRIAFPSSRLPFHTPSKMATSQKVRVLSWNIDMDTSPIAARTSAIIHEIRIKNPDVVMLQEVTETSYKILRVLWEPPTESSKTKYDLHVDPSWPEELPYFPLLLTKDKLLYGPEMDSQRFATSKMFRGYVATTGKLRNGADAMFITSHLESLKDQSAERKNQLREVLDLLRGHADSGGAGIFAGDTNLREAEVPASEIVKSRKATAAAPRKKKVKREKFLDAWVEAGEKEEDRFTWDTQKNDNLEMNIDFRPKARYDRAFLLPSNRIVTKEFTTVGKEKLACGVYASDHWGICMDLEFL